MVDDPHAQLENGPAKGKFLRINSQEPDTAAAL